jgi:hypothetical protein
VNNFGHQLRKRYAVLEPTCIDELRIDGSLIDFDHRKLGEFLLPHVSDRWGLNETERLVNDHRAEDSSSGMFSAPKETLEGRMLLNPPKGQNDEMIKADIACSINRLKEEINEQITARDFQLTIQSEAVIIYRPYQNKHVPRVSRGVEREYGAMKKLHDHYPLSKSKIILIHPKTDEIQRRKLIFDGYGSDEFGKTEGALEQLWSKYFEGPCTSELKFTLRSLLINASYPELDTTIDTKIHELVNNITPIVTGTTGGLGPQPVANFGVSSREFSHKLAAVILQTDIMLKEAYLHNTIVLFYDGNSATQDLFKLIEGT